MKNNFTSSQILYIKNMVCDRCIKVVRDELENLGVGIKGIILGEVELTEQINPAMLKKIKTPIEKNGFELIEDKRVKIIEKIKNFVINSIQNNLTPPAERKNFSELIEKEVGMDYHYLSSLFSSLESITIEQYIILQKIERAKELLKYNELTLSEIAYKLGYSSVNHLSNQFKKITGLSASQFKNITQNMRKPLDKVKV